MKKSKKRYGLLAFGDLRSMCISAILVSLAVVLAYLCKFLTIGNSLRITFENLPIILCGYLFGPIPGLLCGICADFLNTIVSQYGLGGLNPILTLGAGSIGLTSGLLSRLIPSKAKTVHKLFFCVFIAHIVGNMIIKSFGLWVYYNTPMEILILRVPLFSVIAIIEFILIYILLKSRGVTKMIGKI